MVTLKKMIILVPHVMPDVTLVLTPLKIVSSVTVSESTPQPVIAQKDTSKTPPEPVQHVLQNVLPVLITHTIVSLVLKKELILQLPAHVQPDNMKETTYVTTVLTNVLPVLTLHTNVSLVLMKPETHPQNVTVNQVISILDIKPNVESVTHNVLNVLITLITVLFVTIPESKVLNQPVIVITTNMLMLTLSVKPVPINVPLVKDLLLTVLLVLISELQLTIVHVQLDIMKMMVLLPVMLVLQDVLNVKIQLITVLFVMIKEFKLHQNVHVILDIMLMKVNVESVVFIVLLVKLLNLTVSHVLKTESKLQPVFVQKELSNIMKLLIVQLVTINVLYVKLIQTIVSPVLMDMLIHQNVQLLQLKLLQLKFMTFQSVLFKLLTVLFLVKLVNNTLITVSFVTLTELIHQPVCVLMDTIPIPQTNVKSVTSDVQLVPLFPTIILQVASFVLKTELMLHIVDVQLVCMMMEFPFNVKHVTITVLNVTSMDVPFVPLTESIHLNVSVNQVCLKMENKNVNLVQIIVKPVLMLKPVLLAQITLTEIQLQNVHVFLASLKKNKNVKLVSSNVQNVT